MATSGRDNLDRNWRGQNHQSTVKKAVTYYTKDDNGRYTSVGSLSPGTLMTYIDSLTEDHLKAAFRLSTSEDVYYANIDFFVKPLSAQATATRLTPASFGLEDKTFSSVTQYYNAVVSAITSRDDIDGELFDYLFELLDYVYNGSGNYTGIDFSNIPWSQIQNYYAEVLGPIACIKRGVLGSVVNTTGIASAKIYMPADSGELYDYKVMFGDIEHKISAKSARGVSNQVKPQLVIPYIKSFDLLNTTEYAVLQSLADERERKSVIRGPFYTWQLIQKNNEVTQACIADILSNYTTGSKSNTKISDPTIWQNFVNLHIPAKKSKANIKNVTYGELRYKCELLIESWSKTGNQNRVLKEIFQEFLNESRVIYVKMEVSKTTGVASFSASSGTGVSLIRNLSLRSSNYATRTEDRIGFQVS